MSNETFKKRQKEVARREKQQQKAARRMERRNEKARAEGKVQEEETLKIVDSASLTTTAVFRLPSAST